MKLIGSLASPYTRKVRIVLAEKKIDYDFEIDNPWKVDAGLAAMDSELGDKPWCVGNGYTLADIALGVCLGWLDFRYPKMDWKKDQANLARAFAKLSERQSFSDTLPKE